MRIRAHRIVLFSVVASVWLCSVHRALGSPVVVADFEDGTSDFSGALAHDGSAKEGSGAGKIEADFSGPGDPWVTAERTLDVPVELKSLSFWAKSSDFSGLTIRFTDSTGQIHQQRPTFAADGQWHQITLTTFDSGQGYQRWGGANDGKFHWPATSVAIIAEKPLLGGKTKGTVWVDQIVGESVAEIPKEAAPTSVVLGDFENDADGFNGPVERVTGDAKVGKAFARVDADFSKPGDPWVTASKELELTNEFKAVSFWVRSSDANGLTFRLVDSTGQTHQQRPTFAADGQWHRINIRAFDRGPGYQRWGGANDGKFHWPATQLALIFEKPNLGGKTKGAGDIDDVEIAVAGQVKGALDALKSIPIATFEDGTDSFAGAIERETKDVKEGKAAGKMTADFSKPGDAWVTASRDLAIKNDVKAIRFWVKSSDANSLTVRLVDAGGQVHQQRPSFPADGQWHQVTLAKLTGGPGYERWGGAADGQFHNPATTFGFILEKPALAGKTAGVVLIDQVEALVDPNVAVPVAQVEQQQLGNVYFTTEKVDIKLHTQADSVKWGVSDFWKNKVSEGTAAVAENYASIDPGAKLRGWYLLDMVAEKGGQELAKVQTTFCVITPIDLKETKGSPFGVMTHFAQDWDTDIMPLIAKAGISTIRDELYWEQVERKPGEYVFRPQFEKYMAEAKRLGIDPLIIMSFANPLYDDGKTPYTAEGCDAYGRYGQAILKKFGDQIKWLEVWNEYNGSWCTGPAADDRPRYYAQMLKHAEAKIKEVRPDVTVLGGAAVLQPLPYFDGIFKHGGLSDMDAAVIHPYRGNPEGVDQDVNDLQKLAKQYNGKGVPIWATETGLIDTNPGGRERIARYLVRQYTLLLSSGVEKIYWYLCRDYDQFQSMGLLRDGKDPLGKYVPAPAYVAYANLIRQLNGAKYVGRDSLGTNHAYVEQFADKTGQSIRVCWATAPIHVAFKAAGPVSLVDMMGSETSLTPVDGQVYLTLTDAPVYLKGNATPIESGHFAIDAEQTVDVGDKLGLRFSYDNSNGSSEASGAVSVLGTSMPFKVSAGQKQTFEIVVPNESTSRPDVRTYWYELTTANGVAARGGVLTRVVDGLTIQGDPAMVSDRVVHLTLANHSADVSYKLNGVDWSVAGKGAQQSLDTQVAPGSAVMLDLPVDAVQPYKTVPVTVTVKLADREPVVYAEPLSYNPVPKRSGAIDGASLSADANVRVAYDDKNLYLAGGLVGDSLVLGVASNRVPQLSNETGWYEFRVTSTAVQVVLGPDVTTPQDIAGSSVKSNGGEIEVAIPWAAMKPIQPSDGQIRLALAADNLALFGDGIVRGKTPILYRVGQFVDDKPVATPETATATLSKLDATVAAASGEGKVIADSYQDYSNTQGRNGWSYGYYSGDGKGAGDGALPSGPYTDDDFKPLKFYETMWGYEWSEPSIQYMKLTPSGGHPGVIGSKAVWVVRRWVSPVDGTVRITGKINRFNNDGDGIEGKIVADGVIVWSRLIGGADRAKAAECDMVVKVKKGSILDFAITPGVAADTQYDAAEFSMQIRQLAGK